MTATIEFKRTLDLSLLPLVEAQVEKARKLATRLGAPQPDVFLSPAYNVESGRRSPITRKPVLKAVFDAEITIEPLKYNGWTLRARIEYDKNIGTLVHTVPGQTVPEAYRTAKPTCDHCQAKRARKDTFVLQHDDGRWFCVGRQCVADFLGHNVNLLSGWNVLNSLNDDEFWDGLRSDPHYSVADELIPYTSAITQLAGFISRKQAELSGGTTTSSLLDIVVHPNDVTDLKGNVIKHLFCRELLKPSEIAHRVIAEAQKLSSTISADVSAYWASVTPKGEFEANCQKVFATQEITSKHFGLFAAGVNSYFRAIGEKAERKAAPVPNYVGVEGKREVFADLTCSKVISFDTEYGTLHINKLLDAAGNVIVWKAASHRLTEGLHYAGKCTVKKHDEYKGVKQTIVSRCDLQ